MKLLLAYTKINIVVNKVVLRLSYMGSVFFPFYCEMTNNKYLFQSPRIF